MNELKKCPFCGGEIRFVKTGCSSRGKIGHLYCDGCKEIFFKNDKWHTESELYKKWNNRKPAEEVVAKLEEESDYWLELYDVQWKKGFIDSYADGFFDGCEKAIEIVKEGMG